MANRYLRQFPKTADSEMVILDGYVEIGGASGTTVLSNTLPLTASIANTGTGLFTITLADAYPSLKSCTLTVECSNPVAVFAQLVSHDVVTAKTIIFRLINGSGVAANPSSVLAVNVHIALKNSTLATGS